MLKVILFTLLSSCMLLAQSKVQKLTYVPGELIIKYEKDGVRPQGSGILNEYDEVIKRLNTAIPNVKIKSYSPAFKNVVNEMVRSNVSEEELTQIKRLNKNLKSNLIDYKPAEFSTILIVKTEKSDENIIKLADEINNNIGLLSTSSGLRIKYAEPNYLKIAEGGSTDPLYSQQWSHTITSIAQAWAITQGDPGIKIAIIDTGVDPEHPDLKANIAAGGYDFVDIDTMNYKNAGYTTLPGEDYTVPDNDFSDFNGHGTHCAGIAAAIGDNGIGVKGAAPGCSILPVRAGFSMIADQEYGFLETISIINAIKYAADNGANVISMSFGGSYSELEKEAIKYAYDRNVVLIAAAGNSSSMEKAYPAAYEGVLAVTSINKNKMKSEFSNYGFWTDIAVPGKDIISTVPVKGGALSDSSGYKILSGTSMAAPYAAGAAALLLSLKPGLSNELVYQTLKSSVDPYLELSAYIGTGYINVYKILSAGEACISKITSPVIFHNLFVNSSLSISGKASGKYFSRYVFEYHSYLESTGNWQQIGEYYTSAVDSGYLGEVSLPQDGIYYLRLRVISTDNKEYTDMIGPITVDKMMKDNWGPATGYESVTSPAISDIDKDMQMETIFANSHGDIYVLDAEGKNKPGWPVTLTNELGIGIQGGVGYSSPAVDDIDNDGFEEIVARDGQKLFVFDYKGVLKSGWPAVMGWIIQGNGVFSSPVIADINNDGKKEIIITHRGYHGADGKILIYDYKGSDLAFWPIELEERMTYATPAVCDLDGDGNVEIIIQCLKEDTRQGYIYVYDKLGNILPGFPLEIAKGSLNSPIAADINNDGKNEIIACSHVGSAIVGKLGIYVINKNGTMADGFPVLLDYQQFSCYNITPGISAGDINNDGFKEILVGTQGMASALWVVKKNGTLLWKVNGNGYEYVESSSPLIADINGDTKPEIIISKYNNIRLYGKILVLDNNGHELSDLSKYVPEQFRTTPSISDIDGDNKLELVCPSVKGNIFCWDYDAPYTKKSLVWPTYQLNNCRTGALIAEPIAPEIIQLIQPLNNAVNQPKSPLLKWKPADGALKYHLQVSDQVSFNNIVYEDTAAAEVTKYVNSLYDNKLYYWRVKAKNNYGSSEWSDVWNFTTIKPIPNIPVLVYPANNVKGTAVNLQLKWQKAKNSDAYRLILSYDSKAENIIINDSTLADTLKELSGLDEGKKYYWKISSRNIAGESNFTDVWNFVTILTNPDSLTSFANNDGKVILKWKDRTNFETGFKIERKQNNGFYLLDSVGSNITEYTDTTAILGKAYQYRITAYNTDAVSEYSNETKQVVVNVKGNNQIPEEYFISQNYPNPFNPVTEIKYGIPKESNVKIIIFNVLGKTIKELLNTTRQPGYYSVRFNADDISSGLYFYLIESTSLDGTRHFREVKKMMLIK